MYNNSSELTRIETRLSKILEAYSRAQVRGDFYEAILAVHTAIEDALNIRLDEQVKDLSFCEKFERVLPDLFESYSVDQLNRQRNYLGHPKQIFSDADIRKTATAFVDLAIAAWPRLFGHSAPAITQPGMTTGDATMDAALYFAGRSPEPSFAGPAAAPSAIETSQPVWHDRRSTRSSAWRAFVLALLAFLALMLLIGFASYSWRYQPIIWPSVLIPTALALVLGFVLLRSLWRFLRGVGLRWLIVVVSVGAVLATLALVPFTPKEADLSTRAGIALTRLLSSVELLVGGIVSRIPALGADLAHEVVAATPAPVVASTATPEPTVSSRSASPTTAVLGSEIAQPAAQKTSITIGARVRVRTAGAPLLSRAAPGKDQKVLAQFTNGSELTVIEGPATASGLTWWKVQGQAGTGWSAAEYLEAIETR